MGTTTESDEVVAAFIAAEDKRLQLAADLQDAVGDNYDHNGVGPLWHEEKLHDLVDWEAVAYDLFREWNITRK